MKNFLSIILITLIFPLSIFAQIEIDYNDFAKPGENFIMAISTFKSEEEVKIENFKRGNTWDFSFLKKDSYDTIRFQKPSETTYGKYFDSINIVKTYRFSKANYWNLSENGLQQAGVIGDYLHIGTPAFVQFPDFVLQYNFPLTEGDSIVSKNDIVFKSAFEDNYDVSIDSIMSFIDLEIHTEFIEQAELRTAINTFDVLCEKTVIKKRIRTNRRKENSTEITSDSLGPVNTGYWEPCLKYSKSVKYTQYRWYAKNEGIPVAEAILDENDNVTQISFKFEEMLSLDGYVRNPFCKGGNNGIVDLLVRGGIPDYKYKWSNGDTTENLINELAGTYSVEVIDNKNNKASTSFTLTEPLDSLMLNVDIHQITCYKENDGKLIANISGGVPPYYYVWSTNAKKQDSIYNLRKGIYGIIVQDDNNCVRTDSVTIVTPNFPLALKFETTKVTCKDGFDGVAKASASGGTPPYRYKWSTGDTTEEASNLGVGRYNLLLTDSHDCTYEQGVNIQQPDYPLTARYDIKNVNCFGGNDATIKADAEGGGGGYKYLWIDTYENKRMTGLEAGKYHLQIIDKFNCVFNDTIEITQPEDTIKIDYTTTDVKCFGGEDGKIELFVTGGTPDYSYKWSNREEKDKINKLRAGPYSITVIDKNNCKNERIIYVNQPARRIYINANPKNVSCFKGNDGEVLASVTGGTAPYKYKWSNGVTDSIISQLTAGDYKIEIIDTNGCKENKTVNVKTPTNVLTAELEIQNVTCFEKNNGSIFVKPQGGVPEYLYSWSGGGDVQSLTNLDSGTYVVEITDKYDCTITKEAVINKPEQFEIIANFSLPSKNKSDGKIELSLSGGTKPYAISWTNGNTTATLENISQGEYFVTVRDANNCEINKRFEIKEK